MTAETASLVEQLRFLRPTAKFKFAKDQFYMVGKVMHEAATYIEDILTKDRLKTREINILTQENRRLRAALEPARDWFSSVDDTRVTQRAIDRMRDAARSALDVPAEPR